MERDLALIHDIVESAQLALRYVHGVDRTGFEDDPQVQDAVIRRLEIIGEASRQLSEETRREFPQIEWREIIAMRNILIHVYSDVSLAKVWDTVQGDLPPLVDALKPWLAERG